MAGLAHNDALLDAHVRGRCRKPGRSEWPENISASSPALAALCCTICATARVDRPSPTRPWRSTERNTRPEMIAAAAIQASSPATGIHLAGPADADELALALLVALLRLIVIRRPSSITATSSTSSATSSERRRAPAEAEEEQGAVAPIDQPAGAAGVEDTAQERDRQSLGVALRRPAFALEPPQDVADGGVAGVDVVPGHAVRRRDRRQPPDQGRHGESRLVGGDVQADRLWCCRHCRSSVAPAPRLEVSPVRPVCPPSRCRARAVG